MNEITLKCDVGSETISVDFYDNVAGIDVKRTNGESIGLLLSRKDTIKLVNFLQEKLAE